MIVHDRIHAFYRRLVPLGRWAVANPGPATAIVGIILFGARWLIYAYFYGALGTSPDEVGLGFSQAVVESAVAVVAWGVVAATLGLAAIAIFAAFAVLYMLVMLWMVAAYFILYYGIYAAAWNLTVMLPIELAGRLRRRRDGKPAGPLQSWERAKVAWHTGRRINARFRAWRRGRRDAVKARLSRHPPARMIGAIWFVTAIVGFEVASAIVAKVELDHVRHGKSVRPPNLAGVPFLEVQAEPASVSWISGKTPAALAQAGPCLLYLGNANGTSVMYARGSTSVVRLPSSSIVVSVRRRGHCGGRAAGA